MMGVLNRIMWHGHLAPVSAPMGKMPMLLLRKPMTELIWFNGETIPMSDARPGVEDRGSQFADGVYEVIKLYDQGKPFTLNEHLERLRKSATGIQIPMPLT